MVLTKDNAVKRPTITYIDDILVEEAEEAVEKVRDHVNTYRLTAKPSVVGKWNGFENKAGKRKRDPWSHGRPDQMRTFLGMWEFEWLLPHGRMAADYMKFY